MSSDGLIGFLLSIVLHAALVAVILFRFDFFDSTPLRGAQSMPQPQPIQAVAVDKSQMQEELKKLQAAELRKQKAEQERIKKLREAEQKLAQLEKQKRQIEQKKKREEEQARLALKKRQAEEEAARKAKEERDLAEKRLAESKRKAEEAAQKQREERERQEQERKRQEEQARQLAREKALQEQIAAEEAALQRRRDQSELDKYNRLIKDKVTRNWSRPAGWDAGLVCSVMVSLIPGGQVVDVEFKKKCGNDVYDRSMETAIFRASPLPVPSDSRLFNLNYRKFTFEFKVEG